MESLRLALSRDRRPQHPDRIGSMAWRVTDATAGAWLRTERRQGEITAIRLFVASNELPDLGVEPLGMDDIEEVPSIFV